MKSAFSFQRLAIRLWGERWNMVMGLVMLAVGYGLFKWIGG